VATVSAPEYRVDLPAGGASETVTSSVATMWAIGDRDVQASAAGSGAVLDPGSITSTAPFCAEAASGSSTAPEPAAEGLNVAITIAHMVATELGDGLTGAAGRQVDPVLGAETVGHVTIRPVQPAAGRTVWPAEWLKPSSVMTSSLAIVVAGLDEDGRGELVGVDGQGPGRSGERPQRFRHSVIWPMPSIEFGVRPKAHSRCRPDCSGSTRSQCERCR